MRSDIESGDDDNDGDDYGDKAMILLTFSSSLLG